MDLEKVYDKVNWEAMLDVIDVYRTGERLPDEVKAFNFIRLGAKIQEVDGSFRIHRDIRRDCVIQVGHH